MTTKQVKVTGYGWADVEEGYGNTLFIEVDGKDFTYEHWATENACGADLYDETGSAVTTEWPVDSEVLEAAMEAAEEAHAATPGLSKVVRKAERRAIRAAQDTVKEGLTTK